MNRLISLSLLISIVFTIATALKTNPVCDSNRRAADWPVEQIFANTQLDTQNSKIKFFLSNATSIEECAQQCCAAEHDCNLIMYVEMSTCYLIGCMSSQDCALRPNHKKSDPIDYIIKIRSPASEGNQF